MLNREEGWAQLCAWTKTDSLRRHARAVELVMRAAAARYGGPDADVERWGLAGMLHDADYEAWPDEHPRRIVAWLEERGELDLVSAIRAHYTKWGFAREARMDRALLACDELTGFVGACARVRPDGLQSLGAASVLKRLKDKGFAAKVERDEVQLGAQELGVELAELIDFIIAALRPHAAELGLAPDARATGGVQ
jgi:predicted hydrolase (HD superfamily)